LLLFRNSRLWYCLKGKTSNTKPTLYAHYKYTHHMDISCHNALTFNLNLPDSELPKQSALRRLNYVRKPTRKRDTPAWACQWNNAIAMAMSFHS